MNYSEFIELYKIDLKRYSIDELKYVSGEGVWSLGQMYDHVILAALDYLDQAQKCSSANEEQRQGKTEAGSQLFQAGSFPPVKIKLPEGFGDEPSNSRTVDDLMRGLDIVLKRMTEWEEKVDTINPNYKVRHGGFGWLNAREWFDLVGMHFRHHLRQKAELERKLEFRK
ncbi:DinB family protein [Paenibacillus macerans]|uniref:DinB family protein n=1 Tax=Paenibacillus macerans TaxID=44252 RepID=UPI003D322187